MSHFTEEAANPMTLAAMVAGGMAYRMGRMGVLAIGGGHVAAMPLRFFSYALALGSEVSAFEFVNRTLQTVGANLVFVHPLGRSQGSPLQDRTPNLWSWSGPGGWREGLLGSGIAFAALRGTGFLARDQNFVFQQAFQSAAMVTGQNIVDQISNRRGGQRYPPPLAEQFLHAEAMNLQMAAGAAAVHGLVPHFSRFERGLELSFPSESFFPPARVSLFTERFLAPASSLPAAQVHERGWAGEARPGRYEMVSIKDVITKLFGGPTAGGPVSSENSPSILPRGSVYFQSIFDPSEVFPLPLIEEGQPMVLGRDASGANGLFPAEYRNISRQHLRLRLRDGHLEIRSLEKSRGLRINHQEISEFRWYRLRHGDLLEFLTEPRWEPENLSDGVADPDFPAQERDRPALFRFLDSRQPSFPLPAASELRPLEPSPPVPLAEAAEELGRFSRRIEEFVSLASRGLPQFAAVLEANPVGAARDLVRIHRPFCGNFFRQRPVVIAEGHSGRPVVRNEMLPQWEGVLLGRLKIFEESLSAELSGNPRNPLIRETRQKINQVRDQLIMSRELVKTYRQFLTTPLPFALLDSVEAAYAGFGKDSRPPPARVRSASRSLNFVVHEEERRQWSDEFLVGVLEAQVLRNVPILLGLVPTVLGEPVGGSFYRALSMGTLYEGLRSVRALFDTQTGELVAFRDESAQYLQTVGNLRREGRKMEEVSFLVDVLKSGRIAEVAVLDAGARDSIREGLKRLQGLQVLPGSGPVEKVYSVFGTTERDQGGEVWRMSYPVDPSTPNREIRTVVAVTPFQDPAAPEEAPRFVLVTLEPQTQEEGATALQLWVPVDLVRGWEPGAVVRVSRREGL